MKIRLLSVVMTLVMLLLCGCNVEKDPPASTFTNNKNDNDVGDYYRQKVVELAEKRHVEYDGENWIEYDPNRQIYVFTYQYDSDIFPGAGYGPGLYVISQIPLDINDVSLQMPCQTEYILQFMGDYSEHCRLKETDRVQLGQCCLYEYQYCAMLGIDWEEIGRIKSLTMAAFDLSQNNAGDQKAYQAYEALYREYQADYSAYLADYYKKYEALKTKDIPQFYFYHFLVKFPDVGQYEERIESAELHIADEKYSLDIGQLRLHKTTPQIMLDNVSCVGISQYSFGSTGINSSAFSGGYEKVTNAFLFVADQDLTITGIQEITYGTELGLIGAQVRVTGKPDFFWDMQQPIDIEAGSEVEIDLYLKDSRIQDFWYGTSAHLFLEYEIRGKSYAYGTTGYYERHYPIWDIYLMAFGEHSIEDYYAYMVAPYENTWLAELPESWIEE